MPSPWARPWTIAVPEHRRSILAQRRGELAPRNGWTQCVRYRGPALPGQGHGVALVSWAATHRRPQWTLSWSPLKSRLTSDCQETVEGAEGLEVREQSTHPTWLPSSQQRWPVAGRRSAEKFLVSSKRVAWTAQQNFGGSDIAPGRGNWDSLRETARCRPLADVASRFVNRQDVRGTPWRAGTPQSSRSLLKSVTTAAPETPPDPRCGDKLERQCQARASAPKGLRRLCQLQRCFGV